jgi:hypothetical protein
MATAGLALLAFGLVGDPGLAVLVVVVLGLGSVVATLLYVRLTADRHP